MRKFSHQLVLITGGSRGLGLALAREFLSEDAAVALWARDLDELRRAKEMLGHEFPGAHILIHNCDVTDPEQVESTFKSLTYFAGPVSVVVNNAGAILVSPYDSLTESDFRVQMELHLFAVMKVTRLAVDHFRANATKGRIVNICSLGGKIAVPHMLTYDTSKFALAGFSQGLNSELANEGISVTTVYPTVMRTGSTVQAVFKGNHNQECAWFSTLDSLPGVSLSAKSAGRKIVRAAYLRKAELVPSLAAKLRLAAGILFPETMAWTMKKMAHLMPAGQSPLYKTGAQSQGTFKKTKVYKALKHKIEMTEMQLNQREKTDGAFNIGLKGRSGLH